MARLAFAAGLTLAAATPALAQGTVSLVATSTYGNLHAGGVVVVVSGDANSNASAALEWRRAAGSFAPAHPLVRIDATHFAGSLFWLSPGTGYEVRVTLSDPDGVVGPATATAALQTRPDTLPPPTLRTLYVAPDGDDGNPGTDPAAPLRTIQRAADLSQAGDLVSIQPGVYRESVSVTTSGTAGQPIVFRGSAGAILDGADEAIAGGVSWTAEGGGVYSRVTGFETGHVVTEAGRLYRYGTLAGLQALGAGAPGGFSFDGSTLHVKFADNSSPAAHVMQVARLEEGFSLESVSNVRIEGLEIRHYGSGDYGKGVYLRYASDCVVRTSRIHEVGAAGVWIKGVDRHRVEDNEIWDTSIFNWPWDYTKGSSAENNAVVLTDDLGRGHVIRRNTIHGQFNGMGPCGSSVTAGFTTETDIYDNLLYQHTDDALEPEGYCANVRIWGNTIRDVHMAFAVAPASPGPVFIVRNVAWRIGNTRTSQLDGYTASALKINSGYIEPVGPLLVYHNTLMTDAPGTEAVSLLTPGESTFIRLRNNVLAGTRYVLEKYNLVPWSGDWDDFYTSDPTRFVRWEGTRYDTLAAYRAGVGQELNGISAPPQLVDPAGGVFRPAPGSPLVDRGLALPGINDGYEGAAPDIGAVELTDLIFKDGFQP
jgi:hypothetical protein